MSADKPEGFESTTEMAHSAGDGTRTEHGVVPAKDATAQSAVATEQEAKRIEKVRSHARPHHTSGTVAIKDTPSASKKGKQR